MQKGDGFSNFKNSRSRWSRGNEKIPFFSVAFNMNNNKNRKRLDEESGGTKCRFRKTVRFQKNRRLVLVILNKDLVIDISRQTILPITVNINDA